MNTSAKLSVVCPGFVKLPVDSMATSVVMQPSVLTLEKSAYAPFPLIVQTGAFGEQSPELTGLPCAVLVPITRAAVKVATAMRLATVMLIAMMRRFPARWNA
jgi:hypothetical protein